MDNNKLTYCYFDISIDGHDSGRIKFELFKDKCPRTCENFRCLCTGERGKALYYKGSILHRIVKNYIIQGGDITDSNGKGGESIYGGSFDDENLRILHDEPYLLSMANRGPNTNKSQFFITLDKAPHLDGKHVVFGRVVEGVSVLGKVEKLAVDSKSRPLKEVVIKQCGQLDGEKSATTTTKPVGSSSKSSKRKLSKSSSQSSDGYELVTRPRSRSRGSRRSYSRSTSSSSTASGSYRDSGSSRSGSVSSTTSSGGSASSSRSRCSTSRSSDGHSSTSSCELPAQYRRRRKNTHESREAGRDGRLSTSDTESRVSRRRARTSKRHHTGVDYEHRESRNRDDSRATGYSSSSSSNRSGSQSRSGSSSRSSAQSRDNDNDDRHDRRLRRDRRARRRTRRRDKLINEDSAATTRHSPRLTSSFGSDSESRSEFSGSADSSSRSADHHHRRDSSSRTKHHRSRRPTKTTTSSQHKPRMDVDGVKLEPKVARIELAGGRAELISDDGHKADKEDYEESEDVNQDEDEDSFANPHYKCSVKRGEIPEVPANRFLMRAPDYKGPPKAAKSSTKEDNEPVAIDVDMPQRPVAADKPQQQQQDSEMVQQSNTANSNNNLKSRSGRIMKGRGTFKFRTPSPDSHASRARRGERREHSHHHREFHRDRHEYYRRSRSRSRGRDKAHR